MRKVWMLTLLALLACSGDDPALVGPTPEPQDITFRVLSEQQSATFCVEGPEFAVATTDDEWIGVYSRQSDCQEDGEFSLPQVSFEDPDAEWALAAWWKVEGCLGHTIETDSIVRVGAVVTVSATSTAPSGMCATALGALESFLAVPAAAMEGSSEVRFELNDKLLGTVVV